MATRKPMVGGNWKMNTDLQGASDLTRGVAEGVSGVESVEVAVFPPFPYLLAVGSILRERQSLIGLGAQDCYHKANGAFTGEVSLEMLGDCGVGSVLVGHSERRHVLGEDDALLNLKVRAAVAAGQQCVLCVGETLEQRDAGETHEVNEGQLRAGLSGVSPDDAGRIVVAYEPVWAIGTGKTATPEDAQEAHERIRGVLADVLGQTAADRTRVIYGGSMKPSNASDLLSMPDIDGGLVGGASLSASDFSEIVRSAAG